MLYNSILARSFSEHEQKKFRYAALIGCLLIALSFCTVFKSHFGPLPDLNLRVSMGVGLKMLMVKDTTSFQRLFKDNSSSQHILEDINKCQKAVNNISSPKLLVTKSSNKIDTDASSSNFIVTNSSQLTANDTNNSPEIVKVSLQMSMDSGLEKLRIKNTIISRHLQVREGEAKEFKSSKCTFQESRSDYFEINGDISVHGKFSTVFVSSLQADTLMTKDSWDVKPYTRNGGALKRVKNWAVNLVTGHRKVPCNINHSVPAILFSLGGFSGNHFHDFSDLVIPLYTTSRQFNREVQLLVTDYKPWWIGKFQRILQELSGYEIINIDKEDNVHCFSRLIIGLKFHKELGIDSSKSPNGLSMKDFRQFLRSTYSLKKTEAIKLLQDGEERRPRLLVISRRKSRAFENIDEISETARSLGYEVVVAEANLSTDLSKFSQVVNSCDVLMGVHGAGLTNMMFLPDNAILIQIVPLGEIDGLARNDFGNPSKDMNIRYIKYKIKAEESSLMKQYRLNHAILRDPLSVHKQGWSAINFIYLQKQNVKLNRARFRATLAKALNMLSE